MRIANSEFVLKFRNSQFAIRNTLSAQQFAIQPFNVLEQTFFRVVRFHKFQPAIAQLLSQRSIANDTAQCRNKTLYIVSRNSDPAKANLVWSIVDYVA